MNEEHAKISRLIIDGVPFEFTSAENAGNTFKELHAVLTKTVSDRKVREFSFSTSSHPVEGRSIEVLVTPSTSVILDAPLGW